MVGVDGFLALLVGPGVFHFLNGLVGCRSKLKVDGQASLVFYGFSRVLKRSEGATTCVVIVTVDLGGFERGVFEFSAMLRCFVRRAFGRYVGVSSPLVDVDDWCFTLWCWRCLLVAVGSLSVVALVLHGSWWLVIRRRLVFLGV
ncbi:unnamed protein product [Amaranthus hypochondriacus]